MIFLTNSAADGGGLHVRRMSKCSVQYSTFIGNKAADIGGAIGAHFGGTKLRISTVTFINNTALGDSGGGIVMQFISECSLQFSSIIENRARKSGAGIAAQYGYINLSINKVIFLSNFAMLKEGGGLNVKKISQCSLQNAIFIRNRATNGGGIATRHVTMKLNINMVTSISNTALHGKGGGVLVEEISICSIKNSTFVENKATYGAGIYARNCRTLCYDRLKSRNNIASVSGGGIWLGLISNCSVHNSSFIENKATSQGSGVIANTVNQLYYFNCDFISGRTHAIHIKIVVIALIKDCTVKDHTASHGAGVYAETCEVLSIVNL